MKTKIFLAFITVILAALLSNLIFEWLIIRDFDNYIGGVKEDQLYWVMASVEGSHNDGRWDKQALSEAIHWAMMFGLDIKVLDEQGHEVITSEEMMQSISKSMKHQMEGSFNIHRTEGAFSEHTLSMHGKKIGTFLYRPFQKAGLKEKESVFKNRTKYFLLVSFLIAGSGSLLIAMLLSQYLTGPLSSLKAAAEKIAKRDFNVEITSKSTDEVGKLSEAFRIMAESLQREEDLRKRLMSNIAHELRTPLTIMKANAEAIADGIITDRETGLENIRNEIEGLIKLVSGIEDITMAEASFFSGADKTEISLREFIYGIALEMTPLFENKGLRVDVADGDGPRVFTDIEKLERIVRNLLSNSLKFTDKGGVTISCGADSETFFIKISDSGKGIPEDRIPYIFNRFYRVDERSSHKDGGGLGLGLAIVKELTDVMDGSIEVSSIPGTGTDFRLSFPMKVINIGE